jgi:predicted Zn-dependent peptidase
VSARRTIVQWLAVAALAASCGGSPANGPTELVPPAEKAKATPPSPPKTREEPPPPAAPADLRLPTPVWAALPSGLSLATVERRGLPIVEVRVVVRAGIAADGDRPGTATLTAELLKEGGAGAMKGDELLARFEALGSSLSVDVGSDRTVFGLRALRDDLGAALELLGTLLSKPRMGATDFDKAKRRKSAEADDLAQEDGDWGASMVLWRDLFRLQTGRHPYATWDAQRGDIDRLAIADCRAFHERFYVPANTFVVIAGDTTAAETRALVEKAFGNYKAKGKADKASPAAPAPAPAARSITVVDRPGSIQSSIYAATLGPARSDPRYPAFAVLNRVLGGKGTGRLFMDVREKHSLAYIVRSHIADLAGGPSVIYVEAGTQTDRTGLTVQAFLEHFDRLVKEAPSADEVSTASRFLAEDLGERTARLVDLVDAIVQGRVMGLPAGELDAHRKDLLGVTPPAVGAVAAEALRGAPRVIAVAGDAAVIGPMLSRFGEVRVVDAKKEFATVRTIPQNPNAALEVAPKDK